MNRYLLLLIWIIGLELIGFGLGSLTQANLQNWYINLNRSPFTPPDYVFGIAWTLLYLMIAISGWLLWKSKHRLSAVKNCFVLQLILNWSWTLLFFKLHLIGWALLCILAIVCFTLATIVLSFRRERAAAWLLIPYLLWLLFASYLNLYIWLYN